jgi:membrane dipeptidase
MINRGRFSLFADDRVSSNPVGNPVKYSARAVELVGRSMVIDMLGLLTLDWPKLYAWQRQPGDFRPADFQKLRDSGV